MLREAARCHPAPAAGLISLVVYAAVGGALLLPRGPPPAPQLGLALSTATAVANALTLAFLLAGWRAIRRRDIARHRRFMVYALGAIASFLALYVARQLLVGRLEFGGPEVLYLYLYLPLLLPHLVISAACVPPVVYNALVGTTHPVAAVARTAHPRVGRVVVPLWILSSLQGIALFVLLHAFPS